MSTYVYNSSAKRSVNRVWLRRKKQLYKKNIRFPETSYTYRSSTVKRSINRIWLTKKKQLFKKTSKSYCMYFCRFGRCNKGTLCQFIHDPDKVAVCNRFLRGKCKDDNCLFSHKLSPEKIPVCSFYLEGRCNSDVCPYRHVNVNKDADICKFFLKGFCPKGEKCNNLHTIVCKEFLKKQSCSKGRACPLVHFSGNKRHLTRVRKERKPTIEMEAAEASSSVESLSSHFIPLVDTDDEFVNLRDSDKDFKITDKFEYKSEDDTWSDDDVPALSAKQPRIRILPNFFLD